MTHAVTIECGHCEWSTFVREAEGGQTLFGTAADKLARHEGRTGCQNSANRRKTGATVEMWEVMAE